MLKIAIAAAILAFLAACATVETKPLAQDASIQLQGKSFTRTQYPVADFSAFTAGNATFAMIGALASIAEGNKLIKDGAIEDLGNRIGQDLSLQLVSSAGLKEVPSSNKLATNDEIEALIAAHPKVDYILDTRTRMWMLGYYPTDWTHYRVLYTARLRLIDAKGHKIAAESLCKTVEGNDAHPPTWIELTDNNFALLKRYFDSAVTKCTNDFATRILKIKPTAGMPGNLDMPAPWPTASLVRSMGKNVPTSANAIAPSTALIFNTGLSLSGDRSRAYGEWVGKYSCGVYKGQGQVTNPAGFVSTAAMNVSDKAVQLTRVGSTFNETLSGQLATDFSLALKGQGALHSSPDKPWNIQFTGQFIEIEDKVKFIAAGQQTTVKGVVGRDCTLDLLKK
jgi:hypothetical protein